MGNSKKLERLQDLGVNLHTALRKCCDSTPTSIVYNLISLDAFDEAWRTYLTEVLAHGEPVTIEALKAAVEGLQWGNAQVNALHCAFDLFDDNDWAGFIAFEKES